MDSSRVQIAPPDYCLPLSGVAPDGEFIGMPFQWLISAPSLRVSSVTRCFAIFETIQRVSHLRKTAR